MVQQQSDRTHRSSGYGYGSLTELTEVLGTSYGMEVLRNSQKFWVLGIRMLYPYPYPHPSIFKRVYPYPGYLCHGRTELTEVPGTGTNVLHNYTNSGTGSTPGMVLHVPYTTQPALENHVHVRSTRTTSSSSAQNRYWYPSIM